jgi:hypothetical protein
MEKNNNSDKNWDSEGYFKERECFKVDLPELVESFKSLREWGNYILHQEDPSLKSHLTFRAKDLWDEGKLILGEK